MCPNSDNMLVRKVQSKMMELSCVVHDAHAYTYVITYCSVGMSKRDTNNMPNCGVLR